MALTFCASLFIFWHLNAGIIKLICLIFKFIPDCFSFLKGYFIFMLKLECSEKRIGKKFKMDVINLKKE